MVLKDVTEWRAMGAKLSTAEEEIRVLAGLLPMCAWCKQVRNDHGYWEELETYLTQRGKAQFTHGICPSCRGKLKVPQGPLSEPEAGAGDEDSNPEPWPGPRDPGIEK